MKQLLCILALSSASFISNAQTKISLEDISNHIKDSVELSAKVFGVKNLSNAKGSPTFVNLGAAYPNQVLTAVIWQDVRDQMAVQPTEENLKNKTVIVIGKIELYKDKPQIVIKSASQFQVVEKDGEVLPLRN